MKIHEKYISRCIEIAQNGLGSTAPNPMVGAVIVHDDKIIGEGFTSPYGGAHAEVNAIAAVKDKSLLKEATLYVTLEPCSHFGKTPPCADMILDHGIQEIFIGLQDPHNKVAGKGIAKLRNKGCKVTVGVLEKECRAHHKRFLSNHEKQRPYIILKWAETLDGFIAPTLNMRTSNPEPYWITSEQSKQLVHQWRSEEQAILVGTTTVLQDNPKLDVRSWHGKSPIRVIIDKDLKIPKEYHVFDGSVETIVVTASSETTFQKDGLSCEQIDFKKDIALQVTNLLYKRNITSLFIEGGAQTIQTFIDAGLWDEARVFTGNIQFKNGIKAPILKGKHVSNNVIGSDTLTIYNP